MPPCGQEAADPWAGKIAIRWEKPLKFFPARPISISEAVGGSWGRHRPGATKSGDPMHRFFAVRGAQPNFAPSV